VIGVTAHRAAQLTEILADACRQAGLDPTGAQLVAYSSNAVFRLVEPVIVRIDLKAEAAKRKSQVDVATWLANADAPIARLVPTIPQPIIGNGWTATFWQALTRFPKPNGGALASALLAFHQLPNPGNLLLWSQFSKMTAVLDNADDRLPADHIAWLRQAWRQVREECAELVKHLPHGVIHGDAHTGNIVRDHNGSAVLCDLDDVCYGPLDWDLVPTAVGTLRFDFPTMHEEFVAVYGRDVTTTPGWPVLRRLRELDMVTDVISDLHNRPAFRTQWDHRLDTLRSGDQEAKWTPYVALLVPASE
jgi:aminoglycoside phosphotransferase (APT) family kinase protein